MYELQLTDSHVPAQADMDIREITVGGLLREVANLRGGAEALLEVGQDGALGRSWCYAELLADSENLAEALSTRFAPGERVVVWSPNSPEWVLMEYACALSGLVLVTANPAFQEKELRYVLEQSGAVALFLVESFRGNPMLEIAKAAVAGNASIREVIDLNDADALRQMGGRGCALADVQPGDAAQIQYTSGTTGFPKGAVLSHRGLVNNARYYAGRCGVTEDAVWINIMPMFHTSGCGMVTLGCLQAGCKMVLVSLFDPMVINGLIESQRATVILGVPTMVVGLVEAQEASPVDASTLELVSCGGATVAPDLVRRVMGAYDCKFSTLYGQTEYCPVITQHHSHDSIDDICNTIGQPVSQTAVSIRSVQDNAVVPLDTVGEICTSGPCTMLEYNDNPEATAETIDTDGWLHTGDLGRMDARGYVMITGRVKDMIIRGGENHFPAEIENVLLEHDNVAEVSVVGIPDDKWGEVIAAFIRPVAGATLDAGELRAHCRYHLAPQKTPVIWCIVDAFPQTGSGKIQKYRLRDDYVAGKHPEFN
jgi:fatty-acyl-CoA synthase